MIRKKMAAAAILTLALCLGGCGSSYNAASSNETGSSYAAEEAADAEGYYDEKAAASDEAFEGEEGAGTADSGDPDSALRAQDGQKIVYRADVSMQTLEYDKTVAGIRTKIRESGGFSESESEYDKDYNWYYESSSSRNTRTLNITARIPSEKFEAFLNSLGGDGKILSKSVNAENISQTYANKESYKKALEKEQERLLAMMDKAETIDEMIAVESRLSEVERQLNTCRRWTRTWSTPRSISRWKKSDATRRKCRPSPSGKKWDLPFTTRSAASRISARGSSFTWSVTSLI